MSDKVTYKSLNSIIDLLITERASIELKKASQLRELDELINKMTDIYIDLGRYLESFMRDEYKIDCEPSVLTAINSL